MAGTTALRTTYDFLCRNTGWLFFHTASLSEALSLRHHLRPATAASGHTAMKESIGVGFIGSQFVSRAHAESVKRYVRGAHLAGVASPTAGNAAAFAKEFSIPFHTTDYHQLLARPDVDVVMIGVPNDLHARIVTDCARAGKHVVIEKPLCITLAEADQMIAACRKAGVKLMYAEELVFAPKYVRAKQLITEGALGEVYMVKQLEKHSGPHSPWFWDVDRAGGGVLLDMGCHGVELARWIYDKRPVRFVTAQCDTVVHKGRTRAEDNSLVTLEFEGGGIAVIEDSWAFFGGMDDRLELLGSRGSVFCDMVHGNAMKTFSLDGYGYAMEKSAGTQGYSFTIFEESWNYGFPQEMQHFVDCVRLDQTPLETGEDGREVLRILYAAYESSATGRRIDMSGYVPTCPERPIEIWLRAREQQAAAQPS